MAGPLKIIISCIKNGAGNVALRTPPSLIRAKVLKVCDGKAFFLLCPAQLHL
jgi:hypothetical protein